MHRFLVVCLRPIKTSIEEGHVATSQARLKNFRDQEKNKKEKEINEKRGKDVLLE